MSYNNNADSTSTKKFCKSAENNFIDTILRILKMFNKYIDTVTWVAELENHNYESKNEKTT